MDGAEILMADTDAGSPCMGAVPPRSETVNSEASWYAACTRSRHEKSVAKQLDERCIDCFLPLYHSVRRWKDRRKQLDLVLFPGYVFVKLRWRERLHVLQLPGVVRFVTFNGAPAALPFTELEALRNGLAQGVYAETHPYLRVGKKVIVRHGPLIGAQGILIRRKENFRVVISVEAIMRSVAIEVDEADAEPLS